MTDEQPIKKKKKGGPGRPFLPGNNANPKGRPKAMSTMDEVFLKEFFKEVEAMQGGSIVKRSQYRFFVQELIKAGIKGTTPAKKLVLDFFTAVEMRKLAKQREDKQATEGGVGNFNWDAAKEQSLQQLKDVIKDVRRAERG